MDNVFKNRKWLFILLLILIPFCSYMNSLDGSFVFDDARIYNSPVVMLETFSFTGLRDAVLGMEPANRPVVNLTFAINYLVHGLTTRGYHLVNLCIHIGAGLLLSVFLKSTFSLSCPNMKENDINWIAFGSALIWMVHPLQTQAVSYIIQRMTSLSALFFLLSMILYVKGRLTRKPYRRSMFISGSILAGFLAMGCKENAVILPLFVLLYEWLFFQDISPNWFLKKKKHLVGAGIFLVAACFFFLGSKPWEVILNGYTSRDFSLVERLLTEPRVILFYLSLIVFPHPGRLSNEHDFAISTSLFSPVETFLAIAAIISILAFAAINAKRYKLETFCTLWFLGNHLIEGSIIPLELVFEHRNYLPSMMLVPLGIITVNKMVTNRRITFCLLAVVTVVFSFWTYQRNIVWQSEHNLWSDAVKKAPNSARANNNYGIQVDKAGNIDEAIRHYQKAVQIDPEYTAAHYNLAGIFMKKGDTAKAAHHYRQSLALEQNETDIHMALANVLLRSGDYENARIHYNKVLQFDPGNIDAKMKLEGIRWKLNNFQDN